MGQRSGAEAGLGKAGAARPPFWPVPSGAARRSGRGRVKSFSTAAFARLYPHAHIYGMSRTMTAASSDSLTTLDEIVDNFSLLEEWDDRYRYVIELGRELSPLAERDRTGANKVQGCASQVWL